MKTKTCTSCAGTGFSVGVKSGGHLERDYNSICATCGGSCVVNDYSHTPTTNKNAGRPTTSKSNTTKTPTKSTKQTGGSDFSMNDFFMLVGFVLGGVVMYQATDNWIAAVIAGVITGVILRITFKLIFVVLIVLVISYFVMQ